jgi:hypothetical protein
MFGETLESLQHSTRLISECRSCSLISSYGNQKMRIKINHHFLGSVSPADLLWTRRFDDTRSHVYSASSLKRERQCFATYRLYGPWGKREFPKGYYRFRHPRCEGGCSCRTLTHSPHHGCISTHAPGKWTSPLLHVSCIIIMLLYYVIFIWLLNTVKSPINNQAERTVTEDGLT